MQERRDLKGPTDNLSQEEVAAVVRGWLLGSNNVPEGVRIPADVDCQSSQTYSPVRTFRASGREVTAFDANLFFSSNPKDRKIVRQFSPRTKKPQ